MFFDTVILHSQHEGRFGLAWIAAIRGVGFLKKNQIFELDVGKLCDDIARYVCSQSDSPRSRFSLRLSSILINGTVKINKQKAVLFLDDLVKLLTTISAPPLIQWPEKLVHVPETTGIFATPPSPITKVKGKKRRQPVEKETPQSQLDQIMEKIRAKEVGEVAVPELVEQPAILQARGEEITIRETLPQLPETMAVGDLGTFGTYQPEEELAMLEELGIQPLAPPSQVSQPKVRPVVSEESSSPEQPPVVLTVEAQVHVSAEPPERAEPVRAVPKEPRRKVPKPPVREKPSDEIAFQEEVIGEAPALPPPPPPRDEAVETVEVTKEPPVRPVLQEIQMEAVEERDKQITEARKVRKKKPDDLSKLLISTAKPTRVVRIDRCGPDDLELADLEQCPLPEFKLRTPNLTNLLNKYMVRDGRDMQERRQKSDGSSLRDSAGIFRKSGQLTPVELSGEEERTRITSVAIPEERPLQLVPEVPEMLAVPTDTQLPLLASTPVSSRREVEAMEVEEVTREEIVAVAGEKLTASPRKKRKLLNGEPDYLKEPDLSKEPEIPSRELVPSVEILPQETIVEIPIPPLLLDEKGRQQEIVNKILERSDRDRLTLEELCPTPLNKLNVARTFYDLLVLCKHSYVKLVSEDAGTELKFIERGPKMSR